MRQHIVTMTFLAMLFVSTSFVLFGIRSRVGNVDTAKIIPKSSHIAIRAFKLQSHWQDILNSEAVWSLLNSDVFDALDQADAKEFELGEYIRSSGIYYTTQEHRNNSPVLGLREEFQKLTDTCKKYKIDLQDQHGLMDLIGNDLLIAIKLKPYDAPEVLFSSILGGRGLILMELVTKKAQQLGDEAGIPMYRTKDKKRPLFFATIGDRIIMSTSSNFLTEAMHQAKDPKFKGSDLCPKVAFNSIEVTADIDKIRKLHPYNGNVLSSIGSLLYGPLPDDSSSQKRARNNRIQQGKKINPLLDHLILGDMAHIEQVSKLSVSLSLKDEQLDIKTDLLRKPIKSDSSTKKTPAIAAQTSRIASYLPENTIYVSQQQFNAEALLKKLQEIQTKRATMVDMSPTDIKRTKKEIREIWDWNIAIFERAAHPKNFRQDILPNVGPEFGVIVIHEKKNQKNDTALNFPSVIVYAQIQKQFQAESANLLSKGLDGIMKDIDKNSNNKDTAFYLGIQSHRFLEQTIYNVRVDTLELGANMLVGLSENIELGFMQMDDYIFIASKASSLENIARVRSTAKNTLADLIQTQQTEPINLELIVNFNAIYNLYVDNIDYLGEYNYPPVKDHPKITTDSKEAVSLKGEGLRLLDSITASATWDTDHAYYQFQITFPKHK